MGAGSGKMTRKLYRVSQNILAGRMNELYKKLVSDQNGSLRQNIACGTLTLSVDSALADYHRCQT
jgi:hypothetical protein